MKLSVAKITQGGGVAAPVGGQIFSEILPYLEVNKEAVEGEESINQVEVPDITGKSVKEAEEILKENNLQIRMNEELEAIDKENTYIKNQIPQSGIVVNEESAVTIEV